MKATGPSVQAFRESLETLLAGSAGYASWGQVSVLSAALRLDSGGYILLKRDGEGWQESTVADPPRGDLFGELFRRRRKINCVLETRQQQAALVQETIPPILDDQAQLLGPTLRVLPAGSCARGIAHGLRRRYAVILDGGRVICLGRNPEEAWVGAQLTEKTARAFTGAAQLGGARAINRLEAWIMHQFYLLKYSQESERNR